MVSSKLFPALTIQSCASLCLIRKLLSITEQQFHHLTLLSVLITTDHCGHLQSWTSCPFTAMRRSPAYNYQDIFNQYQWWHYVMNFYHLRYDKSWWNMIKRYKRCDEPSSWWKVIIDDDLQKWNNGKWISHLQSCTFR